MVYQSYTSPVDLVNTSVVYHSIPWQVYQVYMYANKNAGTGDSLSIILL